MAMGFGDYRNQLAWSANLLLSASACFVVRGKALVSLLGTGADLHHPSFEAATDSGPHTLSCAVAMRLKPQLGSLVPDMH